MQPSSSESLIASAAALRIALGVQSVLEVGSAVKLNLAIEDSQGGILWFGSTASGCRDCNAWVIPRSIVHFTRPFMYVFGPCMSGYLLSSVMVLLLINESLSERRALAVIAEFLATSMFIKVGRLDSILMLHSLDHIGTPSISPMALFVELPKKSTGYQSGGLEQVHHSQ